MFSTDPQLTWIHFLTIQSDCFALSIIGSPGHVLALIYLLLCVELKSDRGDFEFLEIKVVFPRRLPLNCSITCLSILEWELLGLWIFHEQMNSLLCSVLARTYSLISIFQSVKLITRFAWVCFPINLDSICGLRWWSQFQVFSFGKSRKVHLFIVFAFQIKPEVLSIPLTTVSCGA